MARISYREQAPADSVFAPDAFASQIGKVVPLRVDGTQRGTATLVRAVVAEEGRSAELTVEIPNLAGPRLDGISLR